MIHTLAFKRATAITWYALIIAGSSVPGKKIPEIFTLTPDKLIHCAEYLIFGFLFCRWLNAELTPNNWKRTALIVVLIGALCGMADELYQNLTPNRTPDFYDWCLDFIGVVISIPFFSFLKEKFSWV